jgi:hypothetical protein
LAFASLAICTNRSADAIAAGLKQSTADIVVIADNEAFINATMSNAASSAASALLLSSKAMSAAVGKAGMGAPGTVQRAAAARGRATTQANQRLDVLRTSSRTV